MKRGESGCDCAVRSFIDADLGIKLLVQELQLSIDADLGIKLLAQELQLSLSCAKLCTCLAASVDAKHVQISHLELVHVHIRCKAELGLGTDTVRPGQRK